MKNRVLSLLASIALLSLASCTDEVQELAGGQSQVLKQIVMTTQDFQPESGSRTVYQVADGAVKCTWAENDTVGVFPDKGAQAYFPMALGAGTKNATFDGEGWALKDGRTYGAYYPFVGAMYLDRNAVPVSYAGQTQTGNGSMAHLGDYDYMVAAPTAPEFGSAHFMFKHLSALAQLKITVPLPTTFTSVKLVTDTKAFAVEGKVDIMAETPGITPVTTSTEMVLNLQDVATTKENEVVTFYFMLPPADLSEQTLKAVLVSDKGNVEIDFESKNFKAGTAYALSGEMESTVTGYKDGVVTIAEAGTMKQLLGDDYLNITSLKVVGPINGDDVRCLRQMLDGSEFSDTEKGTLTSLDLSEARIVEGGGWYYEYSASTQYYTANDEIGKYMFYRCANLKEIELPDGATSIGDYAFDDCDALTTVTIGDGVTSIGDYAFAGCSSLTSIDIPNDVTYIGEGAFYNCSSLITMNISDAITAIGNSAFYGCSSLKSVHITDLSAWCKITFNGNYSTPLNGSAKLYLNNQELKELEIPKQITEIKAYVFYGCSSLSSIHIPNGVTKIGHSAFSSCSSLSSINIPDGVTEISNNAFSYCSSLTSIDIPAGVTYIGERAFYNCSSLNSVIMGKSVTKIGQAAFSGCSSLSSIDIPDGVINIGEAAFSGCSSLTNVIIGEGVTEIGNYAFSSCSSLNSVIMGKGVAKIGQAAFSGCSSLKSVHITDLSAWCKITFSYYDSNPFSKGAKLYLNNQELTELVIPEEITEIKAYAFSGYSSLTSVIMGKGVAKIGQAAFSGCSSLTSVIMGEGVTEIGNYAFRYSSSLTSINIPNSVTAIGNEAFYNCYSIKSVYITDLSAWCKITFSNYNQNPLHNGAKLYLNNNELTELVIPADIKRIKDYTFFGCESIKNITIGEQVTSLGIQSFRYCSSLTQVYCQGTTPPTINPSSTNSSFSWAGSSRTLYVPKGCSSAYQSSSWANYFGTITEME